MRFSKKIISWFEQNKRDLPWRKTKNPYFIWLSEIILQQTRVEQGLPYYLKFIKKFPTVFDLAIASEEDILKLWQGLGYYSRARNLHVTAKVIAEKFNGKFPVHYEEILELKGIGKYTAAAIASFAFGLPHPVVDGNVKRILSRIFGISEKNPAKAEKFFYEIAEKRLDKGNAGNFNQAMMEFGAIHCTPQNPRCEICIFKKECVAFNLKNVSGYPAKTKKIKLRNRYFTYLVIEKKEKVFIRKQTENDIWKNLYEFPKIETEKEMNRKEIINSSEWGALFSEIKYRIISESNCYKHVLSHQKIFAKFIRINIAKKGRGLSSLLEIKKTDIKNYPVSRLTEKFLE